VLWLFLYLSCTGSCTLGFLYSPNDLFNHTIYTAIRMFIVCTMYFMFSSQLLQLQQCQDRMLELEKDLENPYDEERVRYLEGKDLPPAEMHEKIEDVSNYGMNCLFVFHVSLV